MGTAARRNRSTSGFPEEGRHVGAGRLRRRSYASGRDRVDRRGRLHDLGGADRQLGLPDHDPSAARRRGRGPGWQILPRVHTRLPERVDVRWELFEDRLGRPRPTHGVTSGSSPRTCDRLRLSRPQHISRANGSHHNPHVRVVTSVSRRHRPLGSSPNSPSENPHARRLKRFS